MRASASGSVERARIIVSHGQILTIRRIVERPAGPHWLCWRTAPNKGEAMTNMVKGPSFAPAPETFRAWLDRAADFAVHWLERETRDPVLEPVRGADLLEQLAGPPPRAPSSFEDVFAEFQDVIARHARA